MIASVLDYLEKSAISFPDKIAFVENDREITFRDFRTAVWRHTENIIQKIGATTKHKPIVVVQEKGINELINFMAIAWTGNIYVPFDATAPQERLQKMIEVLEPILIIGDKKNYEKAKSIQKGCPIIEDKELDKTCDIDINNLYKIKNEIIDTDPLYIICTSGSTGVPKGVVVSHRAVIDFTEEASEQMNFSQKEKFVSQVPFFFDVSVLDIYCTLRNAATLHIVPKVYYTYPAKIMNYIKDNRINALIWVPSALVMVANLKLLKDIDVSCLKKIMFCGEVMPNRQLNMWREAVPGAKYVNYYGPAETTCASTYYIVDREFTDDEPLPIGKPAYNTRILILDEEGKPAKCGEIGELFIEGSGLALGYYNDVEKTEHAFIQNPLNTRYAQKVYRTGDLVRENEYGELIYMGRKDYQIKHMGYRIELGEIETAVNGIKEIEMNCCLYDETQKLITLFYVGDIQEKELLQMLKEKIPSYMIPQAAVKMKELPLNANGKINRVELKNILDGKNDSRTDYK